MSLPTHSDVFSEIVNSMMEELHALPHSSTLLGLLVNNLNSPVLAEIRHLALYQLDSNQLNALLPVLSEMTGLLSLALPYCTASPDRFNFLLANRPAFSKLQSLDLRYAHEMNLQDLFTLSDSITITNLTSLNLRGCRKIQFLASTACSQRTPEADTSGLIALLSSPVLKNLTHLDLGSINSTDPEVFTTLATSPHLSNLVSLDLSANSMGPGSGAALAASTTLTKLTHLNLSGNYYGDGLIAQLFSPPSLLAQNLESLDLSQTNITLSTLQLLPKAAPRLKELSLAMNEQLGEAGVAFIATHMPNLTKLDLSRCKIADAGYAALAASPVLTNLRELNLSGNRAQAQSIVALVNSPHLSNLTHLDLTFTHHGPTVLTALAQSSSMSKLEHLAFSANKTGDEGIIALAQSSILTNLTSLNLGNNRIKPGGANVLCTSPMVSKLTHLNLSSNAGLGDSIAATLAAPTSTLHNLIELNLVETEMHDEALVQLLTTPNLFQLNVLGLALNYPSESTRALHRSRFDRGI